MYLNTTAELTEQIILVRGIMEMSCRITQHKTGMHSCKHQKRHWHLFALSFPNDWTVKLSRCRERAEQKCLPDGQRALCCLFLMSTEVLKSTEYCLETSQQTGSGDVVWLQNNFEVDPHIPPPAPLLLSLSPQDACSAWTSSFLSVGTPVGAKELGKKKKQAVLSEGPSLATTVTWRVFAVKVRKMSSQPSPARLGRFSGEFKRTETCETQKSSNLPDFRGYDNLKEKNTGRDVSISAVYLHFNNDKKPLVI